MHGTTVRLRLVFGALAGLLAFSFIGAQVAQAAGPVVPVTAEFPPDTPAADLPIGVSWGANPSGELGDGTKSERKSPVFVNGGALLDGKEVNTIESNNHTSCAIAAGSLYCWGANSEGQLGQGDLNQRSNPTLVGGLLTGKVVTAVSIGQQHTCAVASGKAYCFGTNLRGQLGANSNAIRNSLPLPVNTDLWGSQVVTAISAGWNHTCAIAGGKAYCWGDNPEGELGNSTIDNHSLKPVAVHVASEFNPMHNRPVTSIAAGFHHSCAVAAGKAACWGANASGQLGINAIYGSTVPIGIWTLTVITNMTVDSISAGGDTTCVVAGKGAVRHAYCFGENGSWQLGTGSGDNTDSRTAKAVSTSGVLNGKSVSSVSVNEKGGCVVAVGKGYCWGDGSGGRLGSGVAEIVKEPVIVVDSGVLNGRKLLTITAGNKSTFAIAVKAKSFSDVKPSQLFYDDISWLAGNGIAQGYADGKYRPAAENDRQAMAAFLYRAENPGRPILKCSVGPRLFTDVGAGNPFCGVIEWMVTAKIIGPGGKFYPADPMTRSSMAGFLYRAHHPGVPDRVCTGDTRLFSDVPKNHAACGNIEWLASVGVTTGNQNGTYTPSEPVTRQAMAAFLHRASELNAH